jgi:hypothetical protein
VSFVNGTFRANPVYELVLLDRLSGAERKLLDALDVEDLYGVLRPRAGADAEPRAATAETALLFLTLSESASLPAYVQKRLGEDLERTIARLVADEVLEIEHEGRYLCGSEAGGLVLAGSSRGGRGRIGELSVAALRYGQALAELPLPAAQLTLRLYGYGRQPLSPALASRLPDVAAIEGYLGLQPGRSAQIALEAGWMETTPAGDARTYWRSWRARRARPASGEAETGYKLYVSPALDALPAAVEAVAGSLVAGRGVKAFKVGVGIGGLCRPDKLVVYFERLDDLQDAASKLQERLSGCPAHGVPFTAAVTSDGLLSWGADPPTLGADAGGMTSWRLWVSARLAQYLTSGAVHGTSALEPWRFALERLRLTGIDSDTWVPANGMWEEAHANA